MPVIEIQALVAEPPDLPGLLAATAQAAADAFGVDVRHCWVTWREIPAGAYFEGGAIRYAANAREVSPLVTIRAAHGRGADQKARVLSAVAAAVGAGLGCPVDNVFVEYREIPPGQVLTGGEVR
jgi:phenylpyruvate tautomerase PptA (4-oxalocrotonate tautomerase family)